MEQQNCLNIELFFTVCIDYYYYYYYEGLRQLQLLLQIIIIIMIIIINLWDLEKERVYKKTTEELRLS